MRSRSHSHSFRCASIRKQQGTRAFTLIELMVVVIVVAILAGLALPSMLRARDDRHAYNDAGQIAQMLRAARLRSIGRGGAVAVFMTSSGTADRGTFQVYEAVTVNPTTNGSAPSSSAIDRTPIASCLTPNWVSPPPTGNGHLLDTLNYNYNLDVNLNIQTTIRLNYVNRAGTTVPGNISAGWVCFTPAGRTYVSVGATPSFDSGSSFLDLDICLSRGGPCGSGIGVQRHVLVPPTGMSRLFSK